MNTTGMRSVILCRKSVLIPVVPDLSRGHYTYEEVKELKGILSTLGQHDAHEGRIAVPLDVWKKTKLQRFFKPLSLKEGGVQRKKKSQPRKEVIKNGKEKVKVTVKAKGKREKKQQVKRKGVRGKTGP